ncbi:alpha/beta fold hydrolase [Brevundimonas sp.]|uniref:alpha/beta hydrolase family protein n=1 Tax=Brevundimonas sp. TaxID=1871086 RepID=UPI0025F3FD88|nr:alpha/beta fold hydrolase [Brevundimonas sp.]
MTYDPIARRTGVLSRRNLMQLGAAGAAIAVAGPAAAQAGPQPHELRDFFVRDQVVGAALSPSGHKVAVLKETSEGGTRLLFVDIFSADDFTRPLSRSRLGEFEADRLDWANDDRLLVSLIQIISNEARVREGGRISDERITHASRRMISIDTVNGGAVVLFENQAGQLRSATDLGRVVDLLPDDPDHILMIAHEGGRDRGVVIQASDGFPTLFRVSVVTGRAERVERGTENTVGWHARNGVPVLRRDVNPRGTYETLYARSESGGEWRMLTRRRITETPEFTIIGPAASPNQFLVAARIGDEDVVSIRELNLADMTYGAPLSTRAGQDVAYGLMDGADRYLGAGYYADRLEYDLNDATLNAHHRALNGFFGNAANVQFADISRDHNRLLLYVTGPQEPGTWFFYDVAATRIEALGARTRLTAERLSATEALEVPTRDGSSIKAYVTGPLHGRPGPLVVLVHGGPELRDVQDWHYQVQALAAQGWWVVQPNFRGSGGYGQAFARSGWREWGGKMQTDVEDAVAHTIAAKGLDASKVAIMGASYGGYAALMGAIRRPDLYKAAIGIAGVYDLVAMLEHERDEDTTPDRFVFGLWSNRIGDLRNDRSLIESASPRRRASEVRCPVMLVHGEYDWIVPISQSEDMKNALERSGASVEYVRVDNAGHGDWVGEIDYALWQRYVRLLSSAFA